MNVFIVEMSECHVQICQVFTGMEFDLLVIGIIIPKEDQ